MVVVLIVNRFWVLKELPIALRHERNPEQSLLCIKQVLQAQVCVITKDVDWPVLEGRQVQQPVVMHCTLSAQHQEK